MVRPLVLSASIVLLLQACSGFSEARCEGAACSDHNPHPPGLGDPSDAADVQVPPEAARNEPDAGTPIDSANGEEASIPGCEPSKLPADEPCVVSDAYGVFVSSSLGSATGDGSRARPLATIAAGMSIAKEKGKRLYVCAEGYAETVVFAEGVSVFGDLDCRNAWRATAERAIVTSPSSPAARADDIVKPTRVQGLDLRAPAATAPGASAYGVIARRSPGLHIVNMRIEAGRGANGADGSDGVQLRETASPGGQSPARAESCTDRYLAGLTCNPQPGATGGTSDCRGPDNAPRGIHGGPGGQGGSGGKFRIRRDLTNGSEILGAASGGSPIPGTTATGAGGSSVGNGLIPGARGVSGNAGANGTDGRTLADTFTASGYVPGDGTAGTSGSPGQGGGGGAGGPLTRNDPRYAAFADNEHFYGHAGGGGGAGGCPGLPGTPGTGGGASIALLVIDGAIQIESSILVTAAGGTGGRAGLPSSPGDGGSGTGHPYASYGGNGGAGGQAGLSMSGRGGPSIAIVHRGAAPRTTNVTYTLGAGGAGAPLARDAIGRSIPASPAGTSAEVVSF